MKRSLCQNVLATWVLDAVTPPHPNMSLGAAEKSRTRLSQCLEKISSLGCGPSSIFFIVQTQARSK